MFQITTSELRRKTDCQLSKLFAQVSASLTPDVAPAIRRQCQSLAASIKAEQLRRSQPR